MRRIMRMRRIRYEYKADNEDNENMRTPIEDDQEDIEEYEEED